MPAEGRGAEDWLLLAETGMLAQPRTERFEAVRRLEAMRLTPAQMARLLLLQAWRAAQERDYAAARELFDRSLPGLDPDRAIAARYGRYVAAVRADPSLATKLDPPEPEPIALVPGSASRSWRPMRAIIPPRVPLRSRQAAASPTGRKDR